MGALKHARCNNDVDFFDGLDPLDLGYGDTVYLFDRLDRDEVVNVGDVIFVVDGQKATLRPLSGSRVRRCSVVANVEGVPGFDRSYPHPVGMLRNAGVKDVKNAVPVVWFGRAMVRVGAQVRDGNSLSGGVVGDGRAHVGGECGF
jgi:hypothetical protein